jgi:hypothetical protein
MDIDRAAIPASVRTVGATPVELEVGIVMLASGTEELEPPITRLPLYASRHCREPVFPILVE